MTRLATAFYDKKGTLCATPPHMANPHNEKAVLSCGFPALPDPRKFTNKVTMDVGYYHRFSDYYESDLERSEAAEAVQQIFDAKNTSILWANSFEYTPRMPEEEMDRLFAAGVPVDQVVASMPKKRYVLDVIYVVETRTACPSTWRRTAWFTMLLSPSTSTRIQPYSPMVSTLSLTRAMLTRIWLWRSIQRLSTNPCGSLTKRVHRGYFLCVTVRTTTHATTRATIKNSSITSNNPIHCP